ncbi:MAG: carboxylesterase family protein [Erysipelotrichaceae bacterium]|nr:carboxylesterase family protein [Erysipelotrichaceae bacterium]
MKRKYRIILGFLCVLMCVSLFGCSVSQTAEKDTETVQEKEETKQTNEVVLDLAMIDNSKWLYNESDDVYYQTGILYCANPADETYETLGIFVPGAYMSAEDNGDGTYTCTVNESGNIGSYTAKSAPIMFPVNTPGHKAQDAPEGYVKSCSTYTDEGFIYVVAGCRGKESGVPAGVTDLKAAIRYIRYIEESIPGDTDRIVVFGHSGGGSQASVLGSSGDSELYLPYLQDIGAADTSDAVAAVMAWCPITSYDTSDLSYEWNMGSTRSGLSDEMQLISDSLAEAYADYVNEMEFYDENGELLRLEESSEGIYQAGSYYEYLKDVIETSLEHYLEDEGFSVKEAQNYIASLNKDYEWVSYDGKEVSITSIAAFVDHFKSATKPIAAFDKLDEGGHELFNTGDGEKTHYDAILYEIVKGTEYEDEVAEDIEKRDHLGYDMAYRLKMFSPLYYLLSKSEGYQSSSVASYWRIRSGINQTDTALTTEVNLALALEMYGADVDFETVWEQGHTQAERSGKASDNLIEWVKECFK